jgi:WhiB family redox-sensing transcriptional regulator
MTLDELLDAPPWMADALCAEPAYPTSMFFPERGEPTEPAKAVCARCLVRQECLAYALAAGIPLGIWGGTSGRERRALRRDAA